MTNSDQIENHLCDREAKWFAIYTRFKSEKEVVRLLARKGIEAYVPINRVVKEYTRKRKVVELPLIHCYVFVRIIKSQYVPVLETNNVLKFIRLSRNLVSIPQHEIDLLKRICRERMDIEISSGDLHKGQTVEIISGNLTGVRGTLIDRTGKNFLVELDYIGIGLQIEIDTKLLRPIGRMIESETEEIDDPGLLRKKNLL